LELLKQYNKIVKTKIHLEYLYYHHEKMYNKTKDNKEGIEQMIEEMLNL